jgi:hypothetical protein
MRISLGLVACAFLVFGLSASADTAAKRYNQIGDLCTAQEVANPPRVKVRYGGRTFKMRVECRTESEWKLIRATSAEADRELARYRNQMTNGATGEGLPPPRPLARTIFRNAASPPSRP